ncbi:hypothetical protein AVEN_185054-1 [Araneus ventricosus]|uniref:Uncharacterized protein n=1 Tax=Araneus ventricosus TaxID=182803 RepID=A0A4Y2BS08_ARAVE|nr:hypothetical protein AVEN_185054-1 [Araneus ventricosus]
MPFLNALAHWWAHHVKLSLRKIKFLPLQKIKKILIVELREDHGDLSHKSSSSYLLLPSASSEDSCIELLTLRPRSLGRVTVLPMQSDFLSLNVFIPRFHNIHSDASHDESYPNINITWIKAHSSLEGN